MFWLYIDWMYVEKYIHGLRGLPPFSTEPFFKLGSLAILTSVFDICLVLIEEMQKQLNSMHEFILCQTISFIYIYGK